MNIKTFAICSVVLLCMCSCMKKMQEEADQKFGDQHFKTTISLVELYKIRHGYYPASPDSIEFMGDWDQMAISSTEYKKLDEGYELNITRGWMGKPDSLSISYPASFWKGLGIKKSNLMLNTDKIKKH